MTVRSLFYSLKKQSKDNQIDRGINQIYTYTDRDKNQIDRQKYELIDRQRHKLDRQRET